MNRTVRLAQLFELKYGLQSKAVSTPVAEDRTLTLVKKDIIDAFNNYFSDSTKGAFSGTKGSIFRLFAETGDPTLIELTYKMDKLVRDLDKSSVGKIASALQDILQIMLKMKNDPTKSVRQHIRDALRGHKDTVIKHHLSRYESTLANAFSLLHKASSKLKVLVPQSSIPEGEIIPQRGDLTKQELLNFIIKNPIFRDFGLDSLDIMEEMLADPDIKSKLTTVINSSNRGYNPLGSGELNNLANEIKVRLDQKKQTNQPHLDSSQSLLPVKDDE